METIFAMRYLSVTFSAILASKFDVQFCDFMLRFQRGDPGRNRTCDPLLRRQMLYPAELRDLA